MIKLQPKTLALGELARRELSSVFGSIDEVALYNTAKVLSAFQKYRVAEGHFAATTGYGYDDRGRDDLERIYADVFGTEDALVRIGFVNGTHAIGTALFGALSRGETLICATGMPYDTMKGVIGIGEVLPGSLADWGVDCRVMPLADKRPDMAAIAAACAEVTSGAVLIQRSRGYADRPSLSCEEIGEICRTIRAANPALNIVCDNCYGEFVEKTEPSQHGADVIVGSLIKNPGGGLAPGGAYIAGRHDLIERAAARMTVAGIGRECGASLGVNRAFYQGFFTAPHTVAQALKTAHFAAAVMSELGFAVDPKPLDPRRDIIQTIAFGKPEPLIAFCKGIQSGSPVDSFVTPEPWDMPGYADPVIMAAGAFVSGASIELSCDAPMREPYTCYLQGGLTFEAGEIGILLAVERILDS
jgi:cystathionine beta-lyase family protein involved in aluminum resistance